jgi:hypothetical protein
MSIVRNSTPSLRYWEYREPDSGNGRSMNMSVIDIRDGRAGGR